MTTLEENQSEYEELIEELFSNVSQSESSLIYKENLSKAVRNQLWEYGVSVIWKVVILFCYEKLFQLNKLGLLNQNFTDSLESRNRDCINRFSFNCIVDKKIGEDLGLIWRNVDQNYQNMFRALLDERNSLSHVNEFVYSEAKFRAYFEKAKELLAYFQKLHFSNSKEIQEIILKTGYFPNPSKKEIDVLLEGLSRSSKLTAYLISLIPDGQLSEYDIEQVKRNAIEIFTSSFNFDSAYFNGTKLIIPLVPHFSEQDYGTLLKDVFVNQGRNRVNQVLWSSGIEEVFKNIYFESINTYPNTSKHWKDFVERLQKVKASSGFEELISLVNQDSNTAEIGGETMMPKCPKCGSENVEKTGVFHDSGAGNPEGNIAWSLKQSGHRCRDCGEHFSAPALEVNDGK